MVHAGAGGGAGGDADDASTQGARLCTMLRAATKPDGAHAARAALKRTLGEDLLAACGLVDAKAHEKRMKKLNTDLVYKQQKYNLLHEDSEGYAKLLTLLGQLGPSSVDATLHHLKALIGYFDLDPNRVHALVLDAAERDPLAGGNARATLTVLSEFKRSSLPQVLGFAFQHFATPTAPPPAAAPSTPAGGAAAPAAATPADATPADVEVAPRGGAARARARRGRARRPRAALVAELMPHLIAPPPEDAAATPALPCAKEHAEFDKKVAERARVRRDLAHRASARRASARTARGGGAARGARPRRRASAPRT